jgi:SnoaL-like domain
MTTEQMSGAEIGDRLAIQELTARYAFYVDTFQIEPLMELWVHDGPVFDETQIGTGLHTGAAAIRAFFVDGVFAQLDGVVHFTMNHILHELDDTKASGVCSVLVEGDLKAGGTLRATAYYKDAYAKVDGAWKFRSRTTIPYTQPQLGSLTVRS